MSVLLLLLWIILNGSLTWEILLTAIFFSALITLFARVFLDYHVRNAVRLWRNIFLGIGFFVQLVWAVVQANWHMMHIVLSPRRVYTPVILKVTIPLQCGFTRVLMASAITLTPGTITIDETEGCYTLHCLDASFAQGLQNSTLVRLLQKMERSGWK